METKLDGWRALVTVQDGCVHVRSRRGTDLTSSLPQLACLTESGRTMVLDGELVVGGRRPCGFYGLAGRLSVRKPTANSGPVAFMAFDLLWLDDQPTIGETYFARRALLESLALGHGCGVIPRYPAEDLDALLSAAEREGMEGVVVKRDRSVYRPGARSRAWAKVKCPGWSEHLERRRLPRDNG